MPPFNNQQSEFKISPEAAAISKELNAQIRSQIEKNGGSIDFEAFMQMALYQPQLGYYQNNLQKFGEKGDFITAPEMGSLFAECIAASIVDGMVEGASILEIGAGSGQLAVDLICSLEKLDRLPKNYFILEPSATLQAQQRNAIKEQCEHYSNRVIWLSDLPAEFDGVIIANEVVDAIPCQVIEKTDHGWCYVSVTLEEDEFSVGTHKKVPTAELPVQLKSPNSEVDYTIGYRAEIRPLVSGWISALANSLAKGHILLIDYGYPNDELYHPQRTQGSLTCFINHHRNDNFLAATGLQDITAHVDFSDLAFQSDSCGLQVSGFTTQAGFLLENGILEKAEKLIHGNVSNSPEDDQEEIQTIDRLKVSQQIQKLMMPGQMGEILKVMWLSHAQSTNQSAGKSTKSALKGFSMQDHLHRL